MPGVFNTFATGYREVVFFVPETTYGTPVHPDPTHAVRIMTASLAFSHERINRADKTTSRSYHERISHRKEVSWSVNLYNLPSGSNGTAPDTDDALTAGFGTKRTVPATTGHASTPSTTTVLNLTAGGGATLLVGDGVGWVNPAGELECTFVESISTDAVTISPPLSAAPATGATIVGSITYKLNDVLGQLTVTRVLDNVVTVYPGCFVNDVSFEFPGTEEGTVTIGGMGKTEYSSGTSALSAMVNNAVTTIPVATGTGARFQANTRVIINAEGANTDEVVLITAVSADNLTVTRAQAGTAASAHASAAVIGPYQPSSTVSGSPVSGTIGEFLVTGAGGATRALSTIKLQNFTTTLNNQGTLRNSQFGTDSATGFFVNKRDVTFSATLWLEKETAKLYNNAKTFTYQEIMIQLGKVLGATTAHKFDKAEFTIPGIDGGGDEEVSITFEGVGLGSGAGGNDELVIAYF